MIWKYILKGMLFGIAITFINPKIKIKNWRYWVGLIFCITTVAF